MALVGNPPTSRDAGSRNTSGRGGSGRRSGTGSSRPCPRDYKTRTRGGAPAADEIRGPALARAAGWSRSRIAQRSLWNPRSVPPRSGAPLRDVRLWAITLAAFYSVSLRQVFREDTKRKTSGVPGGGGSSDMRKSQLRVPSSKGIPLQVASRISMRAAKIRDDRRGDGIAHKRTSRGGAPCCGGNTRGFPSERWGIPEPAEGARVTGGASGFPLERDRPRPACRRPFPRERRALYRGRPPSPERRGVLALEAPAKKSTWELRSESTGSGRTGPGLG